MSNEIDYVELKNKLATRTPPAIVEVLPEEYFQAGHLPGALNLPLARLPLAFGGVLPDPNAEIVLYCSGPTCQNSHVAARALAERGYSKLRVFSGGKAAWTAAGERLEVAP
jgi:rhodanese-related sulfurtransferase